MIVGLLTAALFLAGVGNARATHSQGGVKLVARFVAGPGSWFNRFMKSIRILAVAILLFLINISFVVAQSPVTLNVDASDAAKNIIHSKLRIPVKPGPLTLFYPKWIPGEHSPTGPINDLVGLKLSAGGKSIAWRRDDVEMFAFHCDIPAGVNVLDVTFDDVSQPETTASAKLARIKWNRLLVYTQGVNSDAINVKTSLNCNSSLLSLPMGNAEAKCQPLGNFKDVLTLIASLFTPSV